ncbi:terminase small subunit [Gordonia phage Lucky10]|uniref:Terminase small subunit n=1 Tax=Gordonia phage Lucky10 TaxID=1821557 RepID=A0A142KAW1_9CAUD|nr:terminase small subunit [Gordonia phage Lucky10]AMS03244.1 hypothetical protein SEA_LUCKY10_1 [Gordonia phage Lucky10]
MARKLRAVSDDEKATPAEPVKPLSVVQSAEKGSRLDELKAMRLRLARAIDDPNTPARDLAALTRRQLEIGREIEAIEIAEDEDKSVIANDDDEAWDGTGY